MPRRITDLTDEQRAAIPDHVATWVAYGQTTERPDWAAIDAAIQECYQHAGIPWHGNIVRVPSPFVGALAAPIADLMIRRTAVGDAVRGAVHGAVDVAVGDAVGDAVRGAVGDREIIEAVRDGWWRYCGGQWWANWQAWTAYFRDVCGLELDGDLWDRDRAYATAQSAGWWWPYRHFVVISDRPTELHLEQIRETGWGSHQLHRADGPAITWSDGTGLWFWHGLRVPRELIEEPAESWTVERILRLDNTEIRRAAIERIGWDRLEAQLGEPVATAPDPANAPHELRLYDVPHELFEERVRLVTMTNASPDKDGTVRRYGETVPADIEDPVAASAWGWDLPVDTYRALERAT
jgi:hypothetical protein